MAYARKTIPANWLSRWVDYRSGQQWLRLQRRSNALAETLGFECTLQRMRKALHPDADPTPTTIETVWSDFRPMAGLQFAYRSTDTDLATGKLLQTTTILDIRVNPVVDDHLFEML